MSQMTKWMFILLGGAALASRLPCYWQKALADWHNQVISKKRRIHSPKPKKKVKPRDSNAPEPNNKLKGQNLVVFNLYKKVENWSGQKPRAFNFHPKHVHKIEQLRFDQEVDLEDLEDFRLLKNIRSLYFLAGISDSLFLERLAEFSYERLWFIAINHWQWENLEIFSKFKSLSSVHLGSVAPRIVLKSASFSSLDLNLEVIPKSIDLQDCLHIDSLKISWNDSHMSSHIYLPSVINELEIWGRGFSVEEKTASGLASYKNASNFDLAKILNPTVDLRGLKLPSLILDCSNPKWMSCSATMLEFARVSGDDFNKISKWFPRLEKLVVHNPNQDKLTECLRELKSLKSLSISLSRDCAFSVEKLWSHRFPFVIEADRPGDNPFMMQFFRNGSWEEANMR